MMAGSSRSNVYFLDAKCFALPFKVTRATGEVALVSVPITSSDLLFQLGVCLAKKHA